MRTSLVFLTLIGLGALGFVFYSTWTARTDAATFIQGNLTIPAGTLRLISGNATLSVTGDLTVLGTLACDASDPAVDTLAMVVGGTLRVDGSLECLPAHLSATARPALSIVAKKVVMSPSAHVAVNGSVDIVADASRAVSDVETILRWITPAGATPAFLAQVGPFQTTEPIHMVATRTPEIPRVVTVAELSGTWHVGDSATQQSAMSAKQKETTAYPYLHVDMGPDSLVHTHQLTIESGDGRTGQSEIGVDCDAQGEHGGDALFVRMHGGTIRVEATTITLGKGGRGGDAETRGDCAAAQAIAGKGGRPGNLFLSGDAIDLLSLTITPGAGGDGGDARAHGKSGADACPGTDGGSAVAVGGSGGDAGFLLTVYGPVSGIESLEVARVVGGGGGVAFATGGPGGMGLSCGCAGGNGGTATARGGNGGLGVHQLTERTVEGHGGDAGRAESQGGDGGAGGTCTTMEQGGSGGSGGKAESSAGLGGKGTTATGVDGIVKNMTGGAGGDAGAGCPPGAGGIGGLGAPLGATKKSGVSTCPSTKTPTPVSTATPKIEAIMYHGVYLPKSELIIGKTSGCGEAHWRAAKGSVTATNGTIFTDPIFACGFGKLSETPIVMTLERVIDVESAP